MTVRQPRYSKEEFAQRGHQLYENQVRSQVKQGNYGKIVAIDIETGAFEVADNSLTAAKQLLKHNRDAQIFGIRIGHRAVHHFGFHSLGNLDIKSLLNLTYHITVINPDSVILIS